MAKLGTCKARWQKQVALNRAAIVYEIALRSDGALLEKKTWLKEDGKVDFSDGWKVKTRQPKPLHAIREILENGGYREKALYERLS